MSGSPETIYRANLAAWPAAVPPVPAGAAAARVRVDANPPHPALLMADGDQWVAVHSRRDPLREAERSLAAVDAAASSTLFVIGLGLGYLLDVLDRQGWTGTVVALEPEPACVEALLRRRDCRDWFGSGRLSIVVAPDYEGLDRVAPTLSPNRADPVVIVNPVMARLDPLLIEEALRRTARAWFGARANQEARARNGGRYLLNTLRNTSAICQAANVDRLANRFAGLPAVLVAAGPSLNRNLAELAPLRSRAIVIAADTALRPMLQAAIEPDLVVAVDPGEANARHLVDLPPCPHVGLVAEGSLDREAMRGFHGRLFVFRVGDHHPWPWLRAQQVDAGRLRAWGSVLTTAFDLALKLGCNPIVFTGADLGFTEGQPYARGTTYEEDWRREAAWGRPLDESWAARVAEWPETLEPGIAGVAVRTAPHLRAFRDWLVTEAGRATGRRIVNATGRGILVGPAVGLASLGDVLGDAPPLPETVRTTLRLQAAGGAGPSPSAAAVTADVMRAWREFGRVTDADIERALGRSAPATAAALPPPPAVDRPPSRTPTTAPPDARLIGLSAADAGCVAALGQTHTLRWLELRDAAQDLTAQLRQIAQDLGVDDAVVIVDRVAQAVGGQVRRAVDALLCERPDLWLDYRRFTDQSSVVSIIRADAGRRRSDPAGIDRAKWDPAHAAVADRLVGLIAEQLQPRSVIDLGCGAGFWLQAFERRGAQRLLGLTPRDTTAAVHPGVRRCDAGMWPPAADWVSLGDAGPQERFDLCLALEVAQELPPAQHAGFIAECTRRSDVVVFSSRIPGASDGSPFARPLAYWAAGFWQHGYVLDDTLRPRVDDHWGFPWTLFDVLVVFRRAPHLAGGAVDGPLAGAMHRTAVRLHELYQQNVWWAVRANAVQERAPAPAGPVHTPRRIWHVPAWRMAGEPGELRTVVFRTDAARWYLTDPRAEVQVVVGDRELPRLAQLEALAHFPAAGWTLTRDELTIKSGDGSDPRSNGQPYGVRLPAFVAWAEEQSLADCLRQQL